MIPAQRLLVCLALAGMLGCDDSASVSATGPGSATSPASPPQLDVDTLRAQLEDPRTETRLDACRVLVDHGDDPLVVPALYLRLADEDEDPSVKLAAVTALTRIGGGTVRKTLHAYFYGRPANNEAWMAAGDWLIDQIGAQQIADDLTGMSGREDYDKMLVLEFARRHTDEPPLLAVVERLTSGPSSGDGSGD